MSGDEKVIKMTKGTHFDVMILISKAAIYAGCFKQSGKIALVSM